MLPIFTNDQIASYLTTGFATNQGYTQTHWNVSTGGTMTVNISALAAAGQFFATAALKTWSEVTGINFTFTTNIAKISFFDNGTQSAYETDSSFNGFTTSASIHISRDWIAGDIGNLNSYSYQTYLHEIGHALGLGHAGNYNGSATYDLNLGTAGHNQYLNDSCQTSIMSYFSQTENTYLNPVGGPSTAGFAFVMTPMVADILAVQSYYGISTTAHAGNTIYGFNATAGNSIFDATQITKASYTIEDSNGIDTMDYSGYAMDQKISLVAETFSDIGGVKGSVTIARGTEIENAIGGSGNDIIIGNAADNILKGGAGADTLTGGGGNDTASYKGSAFGVTVDLRLSTAQVSAGDASGDILTGMSNLIGSSFGDTLTGDANSNILNGGAGDNYIDGNGGNDFVLAGIGNDTIVYHAGLLSANVNAGAGTDTLILNDGTLPVSFDLVAANIEGAVWSQHDIGNLQTWSTITNNYDSTWHLVHSVTAYDDNSQVEAYYDPSNTASWTSITNHYDSSHKLIDQNTISDDGTTHYAIYDAYNTASWSRIVDNYDAAGRRTDQFTLSDDGTTHYAIYDANNTASWSRIVDNYDATNHLTDQLTVYDSGFYDSIVFDVNNLQPWSEWHRSYDASGQLISQLFI